MDNFLMRPCPLLTIITVSFCYTVSTKTRCFHWTIITNCNGFYFGYFSASFIFVLFGIIEIFLLPQISNVCPFGYVRKFSSTQLFDSKSIQIRNRYEINAEQTKIDRQKNDTRKKLSMDKSAPRLFSDDHISDGHLLKILLIYCGRLQIYTSIIENFNLIRT